ncbi:hypothetical protein [Anabaena sp. CCY 9402-a]|uniref:hypothetical protein n=1 Tax=Anabaena sp. CCY 9402-a TaxID=3103867 RepID=UPI0039C65E30
MNQESENRLKHFAALKSKYQATHYQDSSPYSLLYLILRKVDLGIEVTELEFSWLREHNLFATIKILSQNQKSKLDELRKLGDEFEFLKSEYQVPKKNQAFKNISTTLYPILWKLNSEKSLANSEIEWLKNHQLGSTIAFAHKMELEKHFLKLKEKYKATQYEGSSPNSPLYKILKKLENQQVISYPELDWLKKKELFETVKIFEQQEAERQTKFIQLKIKYHANDYPSDSLSSHLHPILQKLEQDERLIDTELKWLEKRGLIETVTIAQELVQIQEFSNLKIKYKANQYADSSPKSHLYKVLQRLELGNYLSEQDINFLKKRQMTETIEFANEKYASSLKSKIRVEELLNNSELEWLKLHGYEDIIKLAQQKHFTVLKKKYGLIYPNLPMQPFYTIMVKLENQERLEPKLVLQLMEEDILSRGGKIALTYYKLEAEFYEQEIKRTGNKWHIPTASSYWRKANEPEQALKLTNLDLGRIRENNLKSAILVTRGAAFRDQDNLVDAENCARNAMDSQPDAHQPYTLMGAICYDKYDYEEGDYWFTKAIERGADTEDIDAEKKRVIMSTKDENKRHEAAEYLLKKDAKRYSWAKSYLRKSQENSNKINI